MKLIASIITFVSASLLALNLAWGKPPSFTFGKNYSNAPYYTLDNRESSGFGPLGLRKFAVQVVQVGDHYRIIMWSDKLFELNSYLLLPESLLMLDEITRFLKLFPYAFFTVSAYTDNVASPTKNLVLSLKQAQRIMAYFWAHGIPYKQMTALGYGACCGIADNATPVIGSAYNRRVEINFIKTREFFN